MASALCHEPMPAGSTILLLPPASPPVLRLRDAARGRRVRSQLAAAQISQRKRFSPPTSRRATPSPPRPRRWRSSGARLRRSSSSPSEQLVELPKGASSCGTSGAAARPAWR